MPTMHIKSLDTIDINPQKPAKNCVIWMHGLGADAYDFISIVSKLNVQEDLALRFVFPHAPIRPVTINAGMTMRAWFDVFGLDYNSRQDETGIRLACEQIHQLLKREISQGISPDHIILAGFSQGGALALDCGLRYPARLAGILALSSLLPRAQQLAGDASKANKEIPIMMAHGEHDPLIDIKAANFSYNYLKTLGYPISWHTYPIAHEVCESEIDDIADWLRRVLGGTQDLGLRIEN